MDFDNTCLIDSISNIKISLLTQKKMVIVLSLCDL